MVSDDVRKAQDVSAGIEDNAFSKIYWSSNESLKNLFQCFDVKNKDVLTVLGSSDHLFYSYYYGAHSVDTFDVNSLTEYYYYLRRWVILYQNRFYPSKDIFHNHKSLYQLFDKVKCRDSEEENALLFWQSYIEKVTPKEHKELYSIDRHDNTIHDLKKLKELLLEKKFCFHSENLFDDFSYSKKYDIIITSNILEYAWNPLKLEKAHHNLVSHLREGGQIIGSHFVFSLSSDNFKAERDYFENNFSYQEFPYYREPFMVTSFPLGYSYTKKRC